MDAGQGPAQDSGADQGAVGDGAEDDARPARGAFSLLADVAGGVAHGL